MSDMLLTLAHFHYRLGYIGVDEYRERCRVALWLAEEGDRRGDPRTDASEDDLSYEQEREEFEGEPVVVQTSSGASSGKKDEPLIIGFVCLGAWIFTKSDPDSYPSVPHGHYRNQNRRWPKLNPYTGRVFAAKHQEDKPKRLSKREMKKIWGDESFRSFCREMIVWYQEVHPDFDFPVLHPLRLPRW